MKTTFARIRSNRSKLLLWVAGLLCIAFLAPRARADQGDPPSRVARISFLDGTVSFQPGGSGDWGSAAKNRPVTVGDKLWTDKASRAELQAGAASIHMGSMTALSFLNLDENIMQVRIAEGAVNFRVRELREGDLYEVDTPNLAFVVKQAGAFRVDVSENGDATAITALRGEGEVTAGGKTYPVHTGDRAEFTGVDNPDYNVTAAAAAPDGLDRWAAERDLKEDNATSSRYVSPDVPGVGDLDDNGTWNEEPDYGPVWYPAQVSPGWAPYSYGYWNWVGPWGWTWIGYEPWGFAPYHYGRWAFIGHRWGWCPGPIFARPFYGPAFVGFLGGAHFGVGFGFGAGFGVGWFPLGFREPFFPGFRASRVYVTNINIHNTTIRNVNLLNHGGRNFNYAFAHNTGAITVASRNAFVGGHAINRGTVHVTQASLRGAEVSNHSSFTPERQSSFGAANMRAHATPPRSVEKRSVMARTTPGAAALHMPVRTINTRALSPGRPTSTLANRTASIPNRSVPQNGAVNGTRQSQTSTNRSFSVGTGAVNNRAVPNNAGRTWNAQGNTTDGGRAPQGFGSTNRPSNANPGAVPGPSQSAHIRTDRPPWAGSGGPGGQAGARGMNGTNSGASRTGQPSFYGGSRPSSSPPARSYPQPSRSYSPPRSNYPSSRPSAGPSAAPRFYSPPARTSAPAAPRGGAPAAPRSSGGSSAPRGGPASHGGGGGGRH
jgi:hypothetical protein